MNRRPDDMPPALFDLAAADEYALVYDSWSRSYQKSPFAGTVPNHLWPTVSRATSSEIIERGAKVLVAYVELANGARRVMGYSVSEPSKGVLHWLFVKKDYRGHGYGTDLLNETVKDFPAARRYYTHRMRASHRFLGGGWTHDDAYARVKG